MASSSEARPRHERDRAAACGAYPLQYPEPNDRDRLRRVTLVRIDTEDGATGWGECIRSGRTPRSRGCARWPSRASRRCSSARTRASRAACGSGCATTRSGTAAAARRASRSAPSTAPSGTSPASSPACRSTACWAAPCATASARAPRSSGTPATSTGRRPSSPATRRPGSPRPRAAGDASPDAQFGSDPRRDEACVAAVREAVGPDFGIAADVSGRVRLSGAQAIALARRLEPYELHVVRGRPAARGLRRLAPAAGRDLAAARDRRARVDAGGVPHAPRRGARRRHA